jgi:hippurate hydrolase
VDVIVKKALDTFLDNLKKLLPGLETLYKDIHAHAELSMQETRTAGVAASRLRATGYKVKNRNWEDRRRGSTP